MHTWQTHKTIKGGFYNKLEEIYNKIAKEDVKMLLGDPVAKIGKEENLEKLLVKTISTLKAMICPLYHLLCLK